MKQVMSSELRPAFSSGSCLMPCRDFSCSQWLCTAFPAMWHFGGIPYGWLWAPSTGRGWLPALPHPFQVLWSGGSHGTLPHTPNTLVSRWEPAQVALLPFWLSPDTGWRFSPGNWWQNQRKSSFLPCNLEKSNLSSEIPSSVERLCEICTNGCVKGKGLTAKLPALYQSSEFRSWVLCTWWWKKGKVFFY